MRQAILILALLLPAASVLGTAADAKPEACLTSLEGFPTPLQYDTDDTEMRQNRSYRERFLGGYGDITCPGYVTLRAMTPGLTDTERSVFCLQYDAKAETYTGFSQGKRNAYVHCAQPTRAFCEKVNDSRDSALAIAGNAGRGALSGVNAVQNGAGAVVMSGTGASIGSALSSLGASTAAALSAPAVLAAAAVTVVAVGGTVYVCSE
ncbi:MAG: hypothetical protein JG765_1422 [Cereibacter sp.]|jgi:hypothetical protein|nr:hypothetical protein [Cereibacter sp.]